MKSLLVLFAMTAVAFAGSYTSDWSLHDLVQHLEDPNLDPEYRPYLETALDDMMAALMNGETMDVISVTLPLSPVIITPTPAVPSVPTPPVVVTPGNPTAPTPVAASPLVQIVVNVNNKQQPIPERPVDLPETIDVPEIEPPQVIIVDQAPETVGVVNNPPEAIHIVEQPENPIDIIAVNPPEPFNPADMFPLPIHPDN